MCLEKLDIKPLFHAERYAKGRGLLTTLILSFSYPYVSLHIMTPVTNEVLQQIQFPPSPFP